MPIIKVIYLLVISISLFLTLFQTPNIRKYCKIFLKKIKAPPFSSGRFDELLYMAKLTTFQQLDFTNGKTASVFLQLHIWLLSLLCRVKQVAPVHPLELCSPPGQDNIGRLQGMPAPQTVGSRYSVSICKESLRAATCGENTQTWI